LRLYGSPWQPWFGGWAFELQRGSQLGAKWKQIPADVDILITHGPPYGYGDETSRGERVGCRDLRREIEERIQPRVHLYGHIHEGAGQYKNGKTTFVNASNIDEKFRPTNAPVVLEIET
jgi:Icc-related predicted phosphoesterase